MLSENVAGGLGNEVIRPATLTDSDRIFELLTQFAISYNPAREKFDQTYPELIESQAACVLVAEALGDVVGYALAFRLPVLYANGALWELQELMVDPNRRNEGIGSRLLNGVVERARADGAVEVVLATRRAGGFYEKLGFIESASYYKLKLNESQACPKQD